MIIDFEDMTRDLPDGYDLTFRWADGRMLVTLDVTRPDKTIRRYVEVIDEVCYVGDAVFRMVEKAKHHWF